MTDKVKEIVNNMDVVEYTMSYKFDLFNEF